MRVVAKKVQMIRLQEEYNKREENIETECIKLNKKAVGKKSKKARTKEGTWDERCTQAVHLFRQGIEYPDIAKKVGCNVSSLYRELKKRGALQMPAVKELKPSKSLHPISITTTKKTKFERYKKYYMYK
ncbi:hypothetical protein IGM_06311 [Bacillus cereus HuB4-4]|uniref:Resolvase HTH domain-containing protein n=1 Tax=Bacillus cereus HuB4-4 TaxID=1053211 RepID=A0A9W5QNE9_BACCE|nr:helix-turn-helix domain-containing protein [Bacillus cereus]EOP79332.1 hypothetical protein IGM_06311 [Bacillus cereus HuB4-4]